MSTFQGAPCRRCGGTERRRDDCNRCVACQKTYRAKWYDHNVDKVRGQVAMWNLAHPASARARQTKYRRSHPLSDYMRRNPNARLAARLRSRLSDAVKNGRRGGSAVSDLGCSVSELRAHLEARFQSGMTWENWGREGWHIDHIKPLSKFDLTDRSQFLEACHYTNLQPLWAKENIRKGARCG